MLTNVLKSLVSRADIYDPRTGEPRHPLLAERPEKNILLILVTGDKGLAGAFNTNILKMASKFIESKPDQNIDVECIGRKGRDFMRRRYQAPQRVSLPMERQTPLPVERRASRPSTRKLKPFPSALPAFRSQASMSDLEQGQPQFAATLSDGVIARYCRGEIDAVYILFNEFKSVIAQRLVAERLLPIKEIGEVEVQMAEEPSEASASSALKRRGRQESVCGRRIPKPSMRRQP